ncbi:FtsW/RodA/SpoVE family cell cycle protein [Chakrabartyella piscis]|uniref:FtsW/RodA/SpoVE family cell cycle protein n=1 Tax=Chakrabartyella piscis TaxID=2918914 RepID=UPI002958C6AE|nr:FtsW/RodA/SpoVE family cell cycle protein [Chakrabartyella piscis]
MRIKKIFQNLDIFILIAILALVSFGSVAIASAIHVNLGEDYATLMKHFAFFFMGIVLMLIAANVDYEYFSQFHVPIYLLNLLLLIAVLLIGVDGGGAVRWIAIGPLTIQPSEFAKVMMIFCLSKILADRPDRVNELPTLLFLCAYMALPIVLVLMQPALSSSLVLVAIFCILLFVAGLSYIWIRNIVLVAAPVVGFILIDVASETPLLMDKILAPHQFNRILSFVDPTRDADLYYQTEKSISAIGSGQLTGQGLFQGTLNQLSYLPEPHNDFIFSVIGEEFGFIGCIFVIGVLLFLIFRCIVIAISARDTLGQLLALGVAGMFAFQTFVNCGVALGILPNTGMSLPFVGYGGSAMWTNMIAIGLVLNIRKKEMKSLFEGGLL